MDANPGAQRTEPERGQASVELLGVLPAVLLVALAAWQLVLAGQVSWLAGNAARVGARAAAVGGDRDAAARSALPAHLRRGLRVSSRDGVVTVRVRLPIVMREWGSPVRISGSAALPRQ
jgi:pilus assembly protein CpaE